MAKWHLLQAFLIQFTYLDTLVICTSEELRKVTAHRFAFNIIHFSRVRKWCVNGCGVCWIIGFPSVWALLTLST